MIGVIADSADHAAVREFFELFKTPWEFHQKGRQYDVVICAGEGQADGAAKAVLLYSGGRLRFDDSHTIKTGSPRKDSSILSYQGNRIPIYGEAITFPEEENGFLTEEGSQQCAAFLRRTGNGTQVRIGYDLFSEIRCLLVEGQPPSNADMPAVELHIALLRDLITGCGVPVAEIPPVPDGYGFIVCLTHDVDHPSIRQHKLDHTTIGFLYRAVVGSFRELLRGRTSVGHLLTNWMAALKLPLVHLGLLKDFWRDFEKQYLKLEAGVPSTFFVIPFRGRPGETADGPAPPFRAAQYAAKDLASNIQTLLAAGCEVGLHGIDAWRDDAKGREELAEIRGLTGAARAGVRMHWLYYGQHSPQVLEKAGAAYDSTIGFNGTVGYRAGTTQVYKPLEADRLMELPLHAMDTALFYPAYLGLTPEQARARLSRIADNAARFGGCFTVNWHDRSVAPERLWGASYRDLVQDLKTRQVWFSTAGQAVSWFRKRRSVVFGADSNEPDALRATIPADRADTNDGLPGLRLRIHKAQESWKLGSGDYVDVGFDGSVASRMPMLGAEALTRCLPQ
jgi:hypothetical protein